MTYEEIKILTSILKNDGKCFFHSCVGCPIEPCVPENSPSEKGMHTWHIYEARRLLNKEKCKKLRKLVNEHRKSNQ